jgi:hypothetical protein
MESIMVTPHLAKRHGLANKQAKQEKTTFLCTPPN